ncbi:MAG: tetratricopeptide repeat protein [Candidatus Sericytochromatia bacterium]
MSSLRHARRPLRQLRRYQQRTHSERAEKGLQRLLLRWPHHPEIWHRLGLLAEQRLALAEAERYYRKAVWCHTHHASSWYRLGRVLEEAGRFREALFAFGRYLQLVPAPDSAGIYLRIAQALSQLNQENKALPFYIKALEHKNPEPVVYFYLFQALQQLGDLDTALSCLMSLGQAYPDKLDVLSMLMGYTLEKQGADVAARQCYDEALKRRPRQLIWQLKRDLLYPLVPPDRTSIEAVGQQMEQALLQTLKRLEHQPVRLPREHFFYLSMLHGNNAYTAYHHYDPLPQRRLLGQVIERVAQRPAPWKARPATGKLHLGIVVGPKSIGLCYLYAAGMADGLDPERFRVTLFCPSPEIGRLFQHDNVYRLKGKHMRWELLSHHPYTALEQVRDAATDVLFLTEPGWDFHQYLFTLYRASPVQCTSWMTPGSSGLKGMDYYFSSAWMEPPGAEAMYTETLLRWPVFPSWIPQMHFPRPVPRADFGLSDDWHIYGCLQNLLKFHPDFDPVLGEILRRDPLGHIVMVAPKDKPQLGSLLMQRFSRQFPDVMDRIWVFPELDNTSFLQLLQQADVVLDPFYYGGGTTSCQTLGMGLPLVTLPSERMVGRISASFSRAMGVSDCIVDSPESYVERAIALAQDPAWRADIKTRLLQNQHVLFEDDRAIACLDAFITSVSQQPSHPRHMRSS